MEYAPIVLFVYNRPEHTQKTLEHLKNNLLADKSELFIFADGPKTPGDARVEAVRSLISDVNGFLDVHVTMKEKNSGLAASVIAGVSEIINKYGKVIVMEDDLATSPYFLKYMNDALVKYENAKSVFSITGYSYFQSENPKLDETYFLHNMSSWTWATWKDRWDLFDENATGWEQLLTDSRKRRRFDHGTCFNLTKMLRAQMEYKTIDSWAVRWAYSAFLHGGLGLFPNKTLVVNTGADGSGTHSGNDSFLQSQQLSEAEITYFPEEIVEKDTVTREINKLYRKKHLQHYCKRFLFYISHINKIPSKIAKLIKH